jgi:Bacterial Ig-like domain (group 3)
VPAAVTFGQRVTLTAVMTPAGAGSVTFSDEPSRGPQAGQTIILGTTPLSADTATLTTVLPAFGANDVSATYLGSPAAARPLPDAAGPAPGTPAGMASCRAEPHRAGC